jgi:hypothetical protein
MQMTQDAASKALGIKEGEPKYGSSEYVANKLLGYERKKAPDEETEFAGKAAEFFAGGAPQAVRGSVVGTAKALAKMAPITTAAAGGSVLGEQATDSPWGGLAGAILTITALAYAQKLPSVWSWMKSIISPEARSAASQAGENFLEPIVRAKAERDLAQGLREQGAEKAVENITTAAKLQGDINREIAPTGQQITMTAGQMSGSKRVIDAELESRKASYSANEAAKLQSERNATGILSYIKMGETQPAVTIKSAIDKANAEFNASRQALIDDAKEIQARAAKIPEMIPTVRTAEEAGKKLRGLAIEERTVEDVTKDKIYNAAAIEANKVKAEFNPSFIDETAQRALGSKLANFDPTNVPTVVSKINEVLADLRPKGALPAGMQSSFYANRPVPGGLQGQQGTIKFKDIQAMEQAVNQDITTEMAAAGPNTGPRLRALMEIKRAIQGAVAESNYPELKRLFSAATDYYRDTYSPRFNTGVNAKLWMRDNFGDNKILDENVLSTYLESKNNVNRFVSLFGNNPVAMQTMQDHVFDTFKNSVLKDGVIDAAKYQKFLSDNRDILKVLEKKGLPTVGRMDNMVEMTQKFSDRAATLMKDAGEIADSKLVQALKTKDIDKITGEAMNSPVVMGRLTTSLGQQGSEALMTKVMRDVQEKLVYPPESGKVGLNSQAMRDFLFRNDQELRILARAAYGPQEGAAHLDRLRKSYDMMALQDRVPFPDKVTEPSSVGRDPLKATTGVAITSLWSMMRAVGRGVSSPENAALVLGGQSGSFYLNRAYNNLMQSIASDPESSKLLLKLVETGGTANPTKAIMQDRAKAMAGLLGKAGYFWVGGRYYGPSLKVLAPGISAEMAEANDKKEEANATR